MSPARHGNVPSIALALFMLMLPLSGCKKPSPKGEVKKEDELQLPAKVNARDVTYKLYGPLPTRFLEWEFHTAQTSIDLGTKIPNHAVADVVTGAIYKADVKSTTFAADHAEAKGAKGKSVSRKDAPVGLLVLKGNVHVHSLLRSSSVLCDRLTYDAGSDVIKLYGHVHVNSPQMVGTLPEVWASGDLKKITTPDMFYAKP